jgi:hypothetical protein
MSSSGYHSTAAQDLEEEAARSIERERKLKEQLESLNIRLNVQGYLTFVARRQHVLFH